MLQAGESSRELLRGRFKVNQALALSISVGKHLVAYHIAAAEATI
jgi:hypothetical protein